MFSASTRRAMPMLITLAAVLYLVSCGGQESANPTPAALAVEPTLSSEVTPTVEAPTETPVPPTETATPVPPTDTPIPPTETPLPPTNTPTTIPPTETATALPPTETPTPPPATEAPEPTAEPTPATPQAVPGQNMNVRGGPGTSYPVIASAAAGTSYEIIGQNENGTWWQVCCFDQEDPGWLAASLVNVQGDSSGVAVVEDIPEQPVAAASSTPGGAGSEGGSISGVLIYSVANLDAEKWELWEYNFGTGQSRWLFDWRTEVAYSPDYSQIAYFAWPPAAGGENTGVWIMGADYSGERLVIPGGAAYPSWSPDGGRLVLQGGPDMYIVTADGSSGWKMTTGEYPAWAPNSNWIAHRACVGGGCGIYVTNPDTGEQRRLTSGGSDGQPAWSPNGQQIAYISQDDGNFEIYRVNLDGSNKVRLTNSGTSDGLPVWSPDGQWIAFRSDRGGQWAVYVMRSDGSSVRKIVDAPVLPLWFFEKMGWRR